MYTTSGLAPWVVILITPTLGKRYVPPIAARAPTIAPVTQVVLGTAFGGALDPMATRPPEVRHGKVRLDNTGESDLTINVVNSFGEPLSIFYASNAGGPSPNGDPGPGTLTSSTQLSVPPGWAGRITIGKNYDPMGSKIEASFVAPDFVPDVDVSYVDGYSIPITCSCSGVVVTGCNVPLFLDGYACENQGDGPICYNPEQNVPQGPASPFFAPCQGAAYTYPDDDGANSYGQCGTKELDCCVGPSCPSPIRQPGKRGLDDVAERQEWGGR